MLFDLVSCRLQTAYAIKTLVSTKKKNTCIRSQQCRTHHLFLFSLTLPFVSLPLMTYLCNLESKLQREKKKTLTSSPTMPDMLFVPVFVDTDYHLSSSCIFCRLQAVHVKKSIVSIKKMQRRKDNTHFGSKRHQTHRLCPFSDLVVTRRNDARITCHHHGRVCVCSCYWT